jgi:pimeloyl-ACP methyl ester carboxylesterase
MAWTEQRIPTNGIMLNVVDTGVPEGGAQATLLLMHGLTANLHSFDGLLHAGLAEGVRAIAVDLRGRGLSDKPASGYHMEDHAQDMLGLLAHFGLEQAIFVGHSFGGLLSMYMAKHYPHVINKMVILDAGKEATHPSVLPKIKPSLERLGKALPSWEVYINAIKQSPYYVDGTWNDDLEAYYRADVETLEDGTVRSRVYADGIQEAVEKIIALDWETTIRDANRPAMLIHSPNPFGVGDAPPVLTQEGADETVALLPDCQYAQATGHHITMVFGENAPHTTKLIRDFVLG